MREKKKKKYTERNNTITAITKITQQLLQQ